MKRYLINIAWFSIPLVVFALVTEFLLLKIENSYSYKSDYIEHHGKEIENLILGNSHTFYGIDPSIIDSSTSFNLANKSQSLYLDYLILSQKIDKLPNLQNLILNISYSSLFKKENNQTWRINYYPAYMNINIPSTSYFNPRKYSLLLGNNLKPSIKSLIRIAETRSFNHIDCDDFGLGIYQKKSKISFMQSANKSYQNHENGSVEYNWNLNLIHQIISLCQSKGINILLISTPKHEQYRELLDTNKVLLIDSICKELSKNEMVTYLNYFDMDLPDSSFYDSDHLSKTGATVFSKMIADKIRDFENHK